MSSASGLDSPPPPPIPRSYDASSDLRGGTKRGDWWAVGAAVAVVAIVLGCLGLRAILRGRAHANVLIAELHSRMRDGDFTGIYEGAAWKYRSSISAEDSEALYEAIKRKLGDPTQSSQETTNVNVTPAGAYITASFETKFTGGATATETVVWQSYGGHYRLVTYQIDSLALLTK